MSTQLTECTEIELLLLSVRKTIDRSATNKIRVLLGRGLDWSAVVRLALNHRIAQLVRRGLVRAAPDLVPAEILAALDVHLKACEKTNRYLSQQLVAILQALEAREIPAIAFKGPVLAQEVYGDLALRTFADLDFLIRVTDIPDARKVLGELGFAVDDSDAYVPWSRDKLFWFYLGQNLIFHRENGVAIEPHWALAPTTMSVDLDYPGMWGRARWTTLMDEPVRTFADDDLLMFLCVHGSKSSWHQLLWIADVAEFVDARPRLDWESTLEHARRYGCLRMVLLGLVLVNDLLKVKLPPAVLHAVQKDRVVDSLATRFEHALFLGTEERLFDTDKITRSGIQMRERFRDKTRYVLRTLTTPRWQHTQMVSLPKSLLLLYYPIKLIHDYLLLPFWIGAKHLGAKHLLNKLQGDAARDRNLESAMTQVSIPNSSLAANAVRASWSARSDAWIQWAQKRRESNEWLNTELLDGARVSADQYVLDLGSGVGEPGLSIAQRLGGKGLVVGVDVVPAMLEHFRSRALTAGHQNVLPCVADMQGLPFADESFDSVVCRFGIMFCQDVGLALAEAHRVLKPGGRAAFLVWGPIAQNTIFHVLEKTVCEFFGEGPARDYLTPFRFSSPNSLSIEMHRAGFARIDERAIRFKTTIAPTGSFWQANLEMTFGHWISELGPDLRQMLDRQLEAAFSAYQIEDGYRLENHFRLAIGERTS
jgi:ubiquinone/menaquinone biosynthesis C-methylase UbiE